MSSRVVSKVSLKTDALTRERGLTISEPKETAVWIAS